MPNSQYPPTQPQIQSNPQQPHNPLSRKSRLSNNPKKPTRTSLNIPIQIQRLKHSAKTGSQSASSAKRIASDVAHFVRVLDVENGFAGVDHAVEDVALAVLGALFVDGEVDVVEDGFGDVAAVFEAGAHAVGGGGCREEFDEVNGVGLGHTEAICVAVCVDVVLRFRLLIL